MNIQTLFSPKYIFNPIPGPFIGSLGKYLMVIFAIMVIAGTVAYVVSTRRHNSPLVRKVFSKISNLLLIMGIIGVLLVFFREQRVYALSIPILFYLWMIGLIVWLVFLFIFLFKKVPAKKREMEERKEKEKYLP